MLICCSCHEESDHRTLYRKLQKAQKKYTFFKRKIKRVGDLLVQVVRRPDFEESNSQPSSK